MSGLYGRIRSRDGVAPEKYNATDFSVKGREPRPAARSALELRRKAVLRTLLRKVYMPHDVFPDIDLPSCCPALWAPRCYLFGPSLVLANKPQP